MPPSKQLFSNSGLHYFPVMIDGAKHHDFAGFVTASHAAQGARMRMRQKEFSIKNETQKIQTIVFKRKSGSPTHWRKAARKGLRPGLQRREERRQAQENTRHIGNHNRPVALLFEQAVDSPRRTVHKSHERLNRIALGPSRLFMICGI